MKPNKFNINNELLTVKEIKDKYGVDRNQIRGRTKRYNISIEDAVLNFDKYRQKWKVMVWKKYWHLTIIWKSKIDKHWFIMYQCRCDCWNIIYSISSNIVSWKKTFCNKWLCYYSSVIMHWLSKTKAYRRWMDIKQKCYNPNSHSYKSFWWKWITMSEEFQKSFISFSNEIWEQPKNYSSVVRIDKDKWYQKWNIKWGKKDHRLF